MKVVEWPLEIGASWLTDWELDARGRERQFARRERCRARADAGTARTRAGVVRPVSLGRDGHKSSQPPFSDGLARKANDLRKESGKRQAGLLGVRWSRRLTR